MIGLYDPSAGFDGKTWLSNVISFWSDDVTIESFICCCQCVPNFVPVEAIGTLKSISENQNGKPEQSDMAPLNIPGTPF